MFFDGGIIPDLIPARMLSDFVYCPRCVYLEWVLQEWADNVYTESGKFVHRRIDQRDEAIPDDDDAIINARSVKLSAPNEGFVAKLDIIELDGRQAVPVEYKRGKPIRYPDTPWRPEEVQLCIHALILKENGWECDYGFIFYAKTRQKIRLDFTDDLIDYTRSTAQKLRSLFAQQTIPPPLLNSPKCPGCSLVGICLPDEVNYVKGVKGKVRRLFPPRDDAVPVYIDSHGLTVGISGEVLQIKEKGEVIGTSRLIDTSQLCIRGYSQVTTQAIKALVDNNIPICYFTGGGWFYAITTGFCHKNIELRQHQFKAAFNPQKCLAIARRLVYAKLMNCRTFLRRNNRDTPPEVIDELKRLANSVETVTSLESLLGIEGIGSKLYFHHFTGMIKNQRFLELGEFDFTARNRRPPLDPINAMLSYVYTLLLKELMTVCLACGFDPYQGFYHQTKYGRPSLPLDLMEEFRPILADSTVISAINNGIIKPVDFIITSTGVYLKAGARRALFKCFEQSLERTIKHPIFGYKISYRRTLYVQTRLLGRYLSGEIEQFPAFLTR